MLRISWIRSSVVLFLGMIFRTKLKKFTFDRKVSNNNTISPHAEAKLLDHIWKVNLIPKLKYFLGNLLERILENNEFDISGDCPFCQNHLEDIDRFFMVCSFVQQIRVEF